MPLSRKLASGHLAAKVTSAAIFAMILSSFPNGAHGELMLGITNNIVAAGSLEGSFDVVLTNTGTSASDDVALAGFNFELSAAGSSVTFTQVTTATAGANYIFGSNSIGNMFLGSDITLNASGSDVSAEDNYYDGSGEGSITLGAGETVGLGHVELDLAPGTGPGIIALTFNPDNTSANDPSGTMTYTLNPPTLNSDLIISPVSPLAIPEPPSVILICLGLSSFLGLRLSRRRV